MKLGISKLVAAIGDDAIELQNLDSCAISLDYSIKSGTKITFGTTAALLLNGTEKLGLVLWLPRDSVAAAIAAAKAEQPS